MTQLSGTVELKPVNLGQWLYQLAEVLIPIHTIEVGAFARNLEASFEL